jgi:hypothetical protein
MRRILSVTLAVTLVGAWLIPSSAEAGPLARLFGRFRTAPVTRVNTVERDSYRVYSYEPGAATTVAPYTSHRAGTKPSWMLPKSDPRRYD